MNIQTPDGEIEIMERERNVYVKFHYPHNKGLKSKRNAPTDTQHMYAKIVSKFYGKNVMYYKDSTTKYMRL